MYLPKQYQRPSEIPARDYQGYIWTCQCKKPIQLPTKNSIDFSQYDVFPFLLEGLMYHKSEAEEFSLTIRYTDQYHICEYDLSQLPTEAELEPYAYIAHRLNGIKQLQFQQLWLPEDDPLCFDMPVLRLRARLFTGFIPS